MHPLPRSLDPISGESLTGFLLRLSHRLGLSPLHLLQLAGLAPAQGSHVSWKTLVQLDESQVSSFARLTRLSDLEVLDLMLSSWKDRYPPITASLGGRERLWSDTWLFRGMVRYCRKCLAGDGTVTQRQHGGPWKKLWHLPVVFACPEHRAFLQLGCPNCSAAGAGAPSQLMQRWNDGTLHAAQCRRTLSDPAAPKRKSQACGHRLDGGRLPRGPGPRPSPTLLAFQEHILQQFTPAVTADDASHYFTDLRLIVALINQSWPQSRSLVDADVMRDVARSLESQMRYRGGSINRGQHYRSVDAPPAESPACGGLLQTAHDVLNGDDLHGTISRLLHATPYAGRAAAPWAQLFARYEQSCSGRFRDAVSPWLRSPELIGRRRKKSSSASGDYRPEHIPAFLETAWYERHFTRLGGITHGLARRTAAVRLVQQAMGGSVENAAEFLGLPTTTWLAPTRKRNNDSAEFHEALEALAQDLRTSYFLPTDYRRRRQAMRDWFITLQEWEAISERVATFPAGAHADMGDRKRQLASTYVWVLVTQGEHRFSPRPLESNQLPHVREEWKSRRNTLWHQLNRPDPLPHYAYLQEILNEYARGITRNIDAGHPPRFLPGNQN